jgi:hypothetical protein
MIYHKIIISTCLLFSCNILQALDLNEANTIIEEASVATEKLQEDFSGLIDAEQEKVPTILEEANSSITEGTIASDVIEIEETNLSSSNTKKNTIRCTKGVINSINDQNISKKEEEEEEIEGSATKGLVIFKTRLKIPCKMRGEEFAKNYTQEDWEDIYDSQEFEKVIIEICPKMEGKYKKRWTPHLFQFSLEFASDSDNIPEC